MKIKKMGLLLFSMMWLGIIMSCNEFIEESLMQKEVQLISPGDGYESNNYDLVFLWSSIPNALKYNLQIATPGFDGAMSVQVDTLLIDPRLEINLNPGSYQWRVQALNGSSHSEYIIRSFIIKEADVDKKI